jgi:hypothetical protein
MADTKISALSAKTTPGSGDLLVLVDVSDTTMATSGTDKQLTAGNLATYVASTLAASATTDTTNAANISSGTLGAARLPTIVASLASSSKFSYVDSTPQLSINAGSAASNAIQVVGTGGTIGIGANASGFTSMNSTGPVLIATGGQFRVVDSGVNDAFTYTTAGGSSGTANSITFSPRVQQSGTAGYNAYAFTNPNEVGTGSGTKAHTIWSYKGVTLYSLDQYCRPVYSGTAPTVAVGAGAGTGGSVGATVAGNDAACIVTLTTGSSAGTTNGVAFTLTYAHPWNAAPQAVWIQPANAAAAALYSGGQMLYIDDTTTTTTTVAPLTDATALPTNGTLKFKVLSLG